MKQFDIIPSSKKGEIKMKHDGLKFKDCAKVLKRNGFALVSQNGSHCKFVRDNRSMVICNSHAGVNRMLWKRLCKENNIVL